MRKNTILTLLLILGACAEDLGEPPPPDGGPTIDPDSSTPPSPHITHQDLGAGVTETLVDATDAAAWIALDLDEGGAELDVDIATDTHWDLAIQRYHLRTNGGAGGPGTVRVAVLDGVALADVERAPAEGWRQDEPPAQSEIPDEVPMGEEPPPFTVISGENDPWYLYDGATHQLTPKPRVYVIESSQARYFALALVDYYSPQTADAGWPAFRWKEVLPPAAPLAGQELDASATDAWVYLRLNGSEVSVADAASSSDWDLAFQRTAIRTNGGASGPGAGGARRAGDAWDALETTDSVGFVRDALLPIPGPPGSGEAPGNEVLAGWYDYDPTTHAVSARPEDTYLIRGAHGDYAKLRILSWEGGVYRLELAPIALVTETHRTTIDASASAEWAYFDFDSGEPVAVTDPTADLGWDLAFQRTSVATNGGTSGTGAGGGADTELATLAAVTAVPETFAVDELLPLPGPPGSGAISANPVLSEWYAYDPITHVVSPEPTVFVVRSAHGDFVKVQVVGYADGVFELAWVHAGAGQSAFGGE